MSILTPRSALYTLALSTALLGQACAAETTETAAETPTAVQSAMAAGFSAPDDAWRTVDAENLMIIDTKYGLIGVELYPEIAPNHVAQIKELARTKFYDNVVFHRVIDGFMNQTGDGTNGDGTGDSRSLSLRRARRVRAKSAWVFINPCRLPASQRHKRCLRKIRKSRLLVCTVKV
jgi:hypothetical protein